MEFSWLHELIDFFRANPHVGGFVTFCIAFAESLALIGAVIPGSVTMTAVGALIGSGVMPLYTTLGWAILGALCGDVLSYWIGFHYNERLRQMWPFRRFPQWLTLGEHFFRRHGGKSVIIGRFFGPIRSAVPLIAGLLHMPPARFILATIPSAILWSLVYIVPGIVVGALSLGLAPAAAARFIVIILLLIAFGWFILILLHMFLTKLLSGLDRLMARFWDYLNLHKATHWFTVLLNAPSNQNPTEPSGVQPSHRQLTLLLACLLCLLLFAWVFISVCWHRGFIYALNQPLFELFRSLRTPTLDAILLVFTLLGEKAILLPAAVVMFVGLLWQRRYRAGICWLILVLLAAGSGEVFKHLYFSARPPGLLAQDMGSSFPSGHTLLAVALYGFWAMLISRGMPSERRNLPYLIAAMLVFLVAISRVFLGAHWLTDVLASLFLGIACVCFVSVFYRRRTTAPPAPLKLTLIAVFSVLVIGSFYGIRNFAQLRDDYTLYWPQATLDSQTWWTQHSEQIPLFLVSRLGKPHEVLNIQWLGSLSTIQKTLTNQGWQAYSASRLDMKNTLQRLSLKNNPDHLPLMPTLYQNKTPALWLTKNVSGETLLNLVLWKSNIQMPDQNDALWVGSVYYAPNTATASTHTQKSQAQYYQAVERLLPDLTTFEVQTVSIPFLEQPPLLKNLNWDGRLLLIRTKSNEAP